MSPSDVEVLLHCHYSPEPHPRADAPAVEQALQMFLNNRIIAGSGLGVFNTTSRGRALVDMICATPYPEQVWVDPREK